MEFLPKEQCQEVLFLYITLVHDINDIMVLSYEFHIIFSCLVMHVSLVVCYSFMKENKFLQTVLVQEDEE